MDSGEPVIIGDLSIDYPPTGLKVAVDANGNAIVVWAQLGQTTGFRIHAKRFLVDSGWQNEETISDTNAADNAYDPQIAMNATGFAVVVWNQGDQAYSTRFTAGSGWSTVIWVILGFSLTCSPAKEEVQPIKTNTIA
jgi:hypothetical protein